MRSAQYGIDFFFRYPVRRLGPGMSTMTNICVSFNVQRLHCLDGTFLTRITLPSCNPRVIRSSKHRSVSPFVSLASFDTGFSNLGNPSPLSAHPSTATRSVSYFRTSCAHHVRPANPRQHFVPPQQSNLALVPKIGIAIVRYEDYLGPSVMSQAPCNS